jgi:type IV pilus assembly protein PilA
MTKRNKRGFTLIELLVTVLILAILMAIALPLYLSAIADSERKTCRSNLQTIANANMAYRVRTRSGFAALITDLVPDLATTPKCPNNGTYSITLGTPANSFTVHCSVNTGVAPQNHDIGGTGEPTGYSPGLNSQ